MAAVDEREKGGVELSAPPFPLLISGVICLTLSRTPFPFHYKMCKSIQFVGVALGVQNYAKMPQVGLLNGRVIIGPAVSA